MNDTANVSHFKSGPLQVVTLGDPYQPERPLYAPLRDHISQCGGACNQGRSQCPSPAACMVADEDDYGRSDRQIGGVLLAALLGLLVIGWLMVTR